MKNKFLYLGLSSLFLLGCSKKIEDITYDEVQIKIENKEDFIVLISSSNCPHCNNLKKSYNKSNFNNIYYNIDIDNIVQGIEKNDEKSIKAYKYFSSLTELSFSNVVCYSYNDTYQNICNGKTYEEIHGKDKYITGFVNIVFPLSFFYIDGEIVNFEVGDYSLSLNKVLEKYNEEIKNEKNK